MSVPAEQNNDPALPGSRPDIPPAGAHLLLAPYADTAEAAYRLGYGQGWGDCLTAVAHAQAEGASLKRTLAGLLAWTRSTLAAWQARRSPHAGCVELPPIAGGEWIP